MGSTKTRQQGRAEWRRRTARNLERAMQMPRIPCECGCGTLILPLKGDGSKRRFAQGHNLHPTPPTSGALRAPAPAAGPLFPEFSELGRCTERWVDPDWFFADSRDRETQAAAKRVCSGCPIQSECLQLARSHTEDGIWGGLTEEQRRVRRRKAAA